MFRRTLPVGLALLFAASSALHLGGSRAEEPPTTTSRISDGESLFTFQGRLTSDGVPANGTFNFEFYLFDSETAGLQVGLTEAKILPVTNGVFSVPLNFGPNTLFQGDGDRWVEVRVKKPADPGFVLLNPRQRVTAAPVASTSRAINPGTTIEIGSANQGLTAQSLDPANAVTGALGINQPPSGLVGVAGYATSANPATFTFGGNFNGGTAGVKANSDDGYGVRGESEGAARAGVLGENDSSACTGGTLGPDDPLQQFCFGVAGLASGDTSASVGVYGSGAFRGVWGATTNAAGWSGYFKGGKVEVAAGTTFVNASDGRFKRDITPLAAGLDELLRLKPASYAWKTDDTAAAPHYGFIAQDVQSVLPNLVVTGLDDTLALDYLGFIPVLVNAVQQQQTQIDTLRSGEPSASTGGAVTLHRETLALLFAAIIVTAVVAGGSGAVVARRLGRAPAV